MKFLLAIGLALISGCETTQPETTMVAPEISEDIFISDQKDENVLRGVIVQFLLNTEIEL